MKILLINSNPVVSRLTALSARKEEIQIDEVQEINEISNSKYDIVFVDADSWNKEVDSAISKDIQTQKRVLFYAQDDKNSNELFDISILKPFLPSEVSAVIRSVEEYRVNENTENLIEVKEESIFNNVVEPSKDKKEEKKEEPLFSLDEELLTTTDNVKVGENPIKEDKEEDLFAELKDNRNNFEEQLEKAFPLKKEEELFDLDFKDDVLEKEFDALDKEKGNKKVEKDELFNFDLDSNALDLNLNVVNEDKKVESSNKKEEVNKEITVNKEDSIELASDNVKQSEQRVETKILDQSEVLNIKDILENDEDSSVALDDLMTPAVQMISTSNESKKKEKKKKNKKVDDSASLQADTVIDTLSSLPLDTLKGLLAGATIKVSIKFPKVK